MKTAVPILIIYINAYARHINAEILVGLANACRDYKTTYRILQERKFPKDICLN